MNKEQMDAQRFCALVEAHGHHPRHWPEKLRPAMEAFAAGGEGRAILARAAALDAALADAAAPPPSAGLEEAILAAATGRQDAGASRKAAHTARRIAAGSRRVAPGNGAGRARPPVAANDNAPASRWLAAGLLAASLLAGVWLGLSGGLSTLDGLLPPSGSDPLAEIVRLAAAPDDEGDLL